MGRAGTYGTIMMAMASVAWVPPMAADPEPAPASPLAGEPTLEELLALLEIVDPDGEPANAPAFVPALWFWKWLLGVSVPGTYAIEPPFPFQIMWSAEAPDTEFIYFFYVAGTHTLGWCDRDPFWSFSGLPDDSAGLILLHPLDDSSGISEGIYYPDASCWGQNNGYVVGHTWSSALVGDSGWVCHGSGCSAQVFGAQGGYFSL